MDLSLGLISSVLILGLSVQAAIRPKAAPVCTGVAENCQSSPARTSSLREGILVDVRFHYKSGARTADFSQKVIADLRANDWVRVGTTPNGLAVQLFAQPLDGETVKMHSRLVDISSGSDRLVASHSIVTSFGAKAQISERQQGSDDGLEMVITPSRIRFETE